tara:strand:- start:878 stop:1204 length:327 start_codon:yes stop_codon:yes gene_type:complete
MSEVSKGKICIVLDAFLCESDDGDQIEGKNAHQSSSSSSSTTSSATELLRCAQLQGDVVLGVGHVVNIKEGDICSAPSCNSTSLLQRSKGIEVFLFQLFAIDNNKYFS